MSVTSKSKWYTLRVVSGQEKNIQGNIEQFLQTEWSQDEWSADLKSILLPTEKYHKIQNGKKISRDRNRYPGYLFLEIQDGSMRNNTTSGMNVDLRDALTSLQNVMYFLGRENPIPLAEEEVVRMMGKLEEIAEHATVLEEVPEKGESVKIKDGVFNGFTGVIEEVNKEKKRIKVIIKIFGKETVVDLSLLEIERLS